MLRSAGAGWCGRRDLNPHDFHHRNLNPARLPVPPRPLAGSRLLDTQQDAERGAPISQRFPAGLEHVLLIWNRLRCARARRSARRDAKSDAVTSVERRNEAGARPRATPWGRWLLRRGFVEGLDRSSRYALRPAPARAAKSPRRRRFHMRRTCSDGNVTASIARLSALVPGKAPDALFYSEVREYRLGHEAAPCPLSGSDLRGSHL